MRLATRVCLVLFLALAASPAAAQVGIGNCTMGETRAGTGGLGNELEYGLVDRRLRRVALRHQLSLHPAPARRLRGGHGEPANHVGAGQALL